MTNISNIKHTSNMQSHIDKAYDIIEEHLPVNYRAKAEELLKEKGIEVSRGTIKNVRLRYSVRLDVLEVLLMIAKESQQNKLAIIEKVNQ